MVDEAKESTYVKNPLDLDSINENSPKAAEAAAAAAAAEETNSANNELTPSAPGEDSHSGSQNEDIPPV